MESPQAGAAVHATTAARKTESRTITFSWTAKRRKKFDDYRRPVWRGDRPGRHPDAIGRRAMGVVNWKALVVV